MHGIVVSLYDKFDELAVLLDLVRHNWDREYYVVVSSKHPDARQRLRALDVDVDEFVPGERIVYDPDADAPMVTKAGDQIALNCRVLDSIKHGCRAAVDADCEYVLHLHADAWPLSERRVLDLVEHLESTDRTFAVRGEGFTYRRPGYPVGRVMDQFFVFDADWFDRRAVLSYNPLELLPHTSIHTSMMLFVLGRVGLSHTYNYSDMSEDVYWDGRPKRRERDCVRPAVLDPEWDLLHVATDEFPGDLGRSVQAQYLSEYDHTEGERLSSYVDRYGRGRDALYDRLRRIERRQNRELRRLGYPPGAFGRRFERKRAVLSRSLPRKARTLAWNLGRRAGRAAFAAGYRLYHRTLGRDPPDHPALDPDTWGMYRDSLWPASLSDYYRERVDPEDYPEEYARLWTGNHGDDRR